MDKLRAQRFFLKVAETMSFSGAAKELGVPASSVSRRIQDLEKELGAVLIHRSTRVVKLTELGEVYLARIQPAIRALAHADEIVGNQSQTASGILRINALPGYGRFHLMPALKKLTHRYPNIILDIALTDQVTNLADNHTDIAIRATAQLPDRSVAHKLSDNKFMLIASPDYINKYELPRNCRDLEKHNTLLYRGPNGVLAWQANCADGWRTLNTNAVFICNQGDAIVDQAKLGAGVALVPEWGIVDELRRGELVQITLDDASVSVSRKQHAGIFLLYHKPKYRIQKIRLASDFLVSELSGNRTNINA